MASRPDDLPIETRARFDIVDITEQAAKALEGSACRSGRLVAFTSEDGCALVVNEKETGFWSDLRSTLERVSGSKDGSQIAIGSPSVTLPITDGSLGLGTWQRLLLIELERPGPRSVVFQVMEDPG
ncbi:MAG: YjbQ family protein [Actinomycetota bacterium]